MSECPGISFCRCAVRLAAPALLGVVSLVSNAADSLEPQATLSFDEDIQPIMQQYCLDCHSGWFPKAGLRLETREQLLAGSRSGPLLVPGEPDKGWLLHTIGPGEDRLKMPPQGPGPSQEQIQLIRRWIMQGAQ